MNSARPRIHNLGPQFATVHNEKRFAMSIGQDRGTAPHDAGRWMSPQDVCNQLQIPRQTFYQWWAKHIGPPAYRFGKLLRIDRDEFNEWAASHAEGNRLASDFRGGKSGEGR